MTKERWGWGEHLKTKERDQEPFLSLPLAVSPPTVPRVTPNASSVHLINTFLTRSHCSMLAAAAAAMSLQSCPTLCDLQNTPFE